jgi:hypothetical protein
MLNLSTGSLLPAVLGHKMKLLETASAAARAISASGRGSKSSSR